MIFLNNVLGNNIAYYRRLCAFTQEELAERIGVSPQAVSKWEQGLNAPDVMLLPELSGILGISIDELFGKRIEKEPVYEIVDEAPWPDDEKLRVAVYSGRKLVRQTAYELETGTNRFEIRFDLGEGKTIAGTVKIEKE